jgi:Raf kinase inhibitor-like YbhB/YbcL family protein
MDKQDPFSLESAAFEDGTVIPAQYTRSTLPGGQNISIPFAWRNPPAGTRSFVLAIADRSANDWIHWMVVNIPADTFSISEGASRTAQMPHGSKELVNTFGLPGYDGPQPPRGTGVHDYEATVYALDVATIDLAGEVSAKELEAAIGKRLINSARITGKMRR